MKLFYKPGACSLASHISLRESGLDFTLVGVDLQKKVTETGEDFLQTNPKGQVPTLQLDDNTVLTEGVAIMQYIADSVADRQLLAPVSSISRYKTLEWLNFIATELHKGFTPLFRPDTPEDYKADRARCWIKKWPISIANWPIANGLAVHALPLPMRISLPFCAGLLR